MRRRTEQLSIEFEDGLAKGWAFGVADAFRINLDIRLDQRIDSFASKAKELAIGRKLQPNEKMLRKVWTRGVPPAYSFARGHMFHEPPEAHSLPWDQALRVLRRSIVVLDAQPDAGALIEVLAKDDEDESSSVMEVSDASNKRGWVEIEVHYYESGEFQRKESTVMFQAAFSEFLRTGEIPAAEVEQRIGAKLTIEQALRRAIDNAEHVQLVYNGGSYPGEERPLIPVRLSSDQLIAKEPGLDVLKPFTLRKIESLALKDGTFAVNEEAEPLVQRSTPYYVSLDEYIAYFRPKLAAAGWNVFEGPELLGVGRFTNGGKPRKHPCVAIKFMDRTVQEKLDIQSGELFIEHKELTGRERPWRVESESEVQAKAFADLQRAIEFFAQQVAKTSPSRH